MTHGPSPAYVFGPFQLDSEERVLLRDGRPVALSPKTMDVLLALIQQSGRIVEKEQLLRQVWPDTFVEEGNLSVHMSALRKALGDGAEGSTFIETVPRRGYRFRVPVEVRTAEPHTLVFERHAETRIVREEIEESSGPSWQVSRAVATLAVTLLLIGGMIIGWRAAHRASASTAVFRIVPFASYTGGVHMPAFSPDGERIAFPWTGPNGDNWDIYVKVIGNDPPLRLTSGSSSDGSPTWSPNGRQIAFLREDLSASHSGIYVVGALGGAERKLMDLPFGRYFDLEWSPDGKYLATAIRMDPREPYNSHRFMAIFLVSVDTLEKRQLTFPGETERDQRFAFSPDGERLAFLRHDGENSSIFIVPVAGGTPRRIYSGRTWIGHLVWGSEGRDLIFTSELEGGSKLFRISAEGGAPQLLPLSEEMALYPTVARRGNRMAFLRLHADADLWRAAIGSSGSLAEPRAFRATARYEVGPEFSPDGRRVAFISDASGVKELWVCDADGSNAALLTNVGAPTTYSPSWSPDGTEIAFSSLKGPRGTKGGVFVVKVATREIRRISDEAYALPRWSRNGEWIYLTASPHAGKRGIWKAPAGGGEAVVVSAADAILAQESTDGRTIYFLSLQGGIWQTPSRGGEATLTLPEVTSDLRSFWRVTSTGIFYLNKHTDPVHTLAHYDFASRRSRTVATLPGAFTEFSGGLTVSPDGRTAVWSRASQEASEIVLVENFY